MASDRYKAHLGTQPQQDSFSRPEPESAQHEAPPRKLRSREKRPSPQPRVARGLRLGARAAREQRHHPLLKARRRWAVLPAAVTDALITDVTRYTPHMRGTVAADHLTAGAAVVLPPHGAEVIRAKGAAYRLCVGLPHGADPITHGEEYGGKREHSGRP